VIAAWQRTTHRLLAALDAELAGAGLGPAEVNALAALGAGARTARALADATGQRPSTLTGVVDRLERRGLVERRPNPADRRSSVLEPTAAGRTAIARVQRAVHAVGRRGARHAPRGELDALLTAVDRAL
jgi:MarR family transcriptional regulator, organic hydroperoxide resistance regulator